MALEKGESRMSLVQPLIDEMVQEGATTRRVLQRVPQDKLAWKPHEKAKSLGQLATHIASVQGNLATMLQGSSAEAGSAGPEVVPETTDELVALFDAKLETAKSMLSKIADDDLPSAWSMTRQGKTMISMPKIAVIRSIILNHIYHHRGQLSTYLRILDVPVPSVYGPTADERPFG
jgi:uncharacterized damage-inducible protein DinB